MPKFNPDQNSDNMNFSAATEWLQKDKRAPLVVSGALAVLIALTAGQYWNSLRVAAAPVIASHSSSTAAVVQRLPQIAGWHLFGRYSSQPSDLPETNLPLTLQGTVVNVGNPSESYAVLAVSGKPTKAYRVGDTLPDNVQVDQVFRDRIVIDNRGKLEILKLPVKKLQGIKTGKTGKAG